jgi:hypothetical protein
MVNREQWRLEEASAVTAALDGISLKKVTPELLSLVALLQK